MSVASYRDADVSATVEDMFRSATRPERVFVGVVTQNHPDAETERFRLHHDHHPHRAQVRVLELDHTEARGPCFARYLCTRLRRGDERYYLQIDSHTRFVRGWDEKLVRMHAVDFGGDRKVVLTHYPQSWDNVQPHTVSVNDRTVRHPSGLYYKYRAYNRRRPDHDDPNPRAHYRPAVGVAGGMLFADARMLDECPLDAGLNMVFHGEEFLYSARLHTYGYRFYAPRENVLYHHYYREGQPKFTEDIKPNSDKQRQLRDAPHMVSHLMRSPPHKGYFGRMPGGVADYFALCERHLD